MNYNRRIKFGEFDDVVKSISNELSNMRKRLSKLEVEIKSLKGE